MTKPHMLIMFFAMMLTFNALMTSLGGRNASTTAQPSPAERDENTESEASRSPATSEDDSSGRRPQVDASADHAPLPKRDRPGDLFSRTISEHFRSHPPTELRVLHLRNHMSGKARVGGASYPNESGEAEEDLLGLAVSLKNELTRVGNEIVSETLVPMDLKDEWSYGLRVHKELLEGVEVDEEAARDLASMVESLRPYLIRTQTMPYTVTVIKSDTVNAFAHLGGHIYVFQGMLDLLQSQEERRFVLGHEMGHIELNQCAIGSSGGRLAESLVGEHGVGPARLLQKMMALSFSEYDEYDADVWAYQAMKKMGKSDAQITEFFYTLMQVEDSLNRQ